MFKFLKKKKMEVALFPTPEWRPTIQQPLDKIIDRMSYYTDGNADFAVFQNGTCVVLTDGLSESEAEASAKNVLHEIYSHHPDMKPATTDDGNVLVRYNHPACNIVLADVVEKHWKEINRNHQKALTTHEVVLTPLGPNVFNDLGKKALFGRCFMFMDAQNPRMVKIVRKSRTQTRKEHGKPGA
jgi:hypothetical protein